MRLLKTRTTNAKVSGSDHQAAGGVLLSIGVILSIGISP